MTGEAARLHREAADTATRLAICGEARTPACTDACIVRNDRCNPLPFKASAPGVNMLPSQPTPLLGRADDLLSGRGALSNDGIRLLTLTGPAGVGKTRAWHWVSLIAFWISFQTACSSSNWRPRRIRRW